MSRLVLQESDSLFLSSLGDFGFEPADGSFYVTDQFAGRLLQIDRSGRIARTFGRKGTGPGEFAQINLMFSRGNELFVNEGRQSVFHVFDRRTGQVQGGRRHEGIFRDVRLVGNTAWLGMQNSTHGTAVARWDLDSDSVRYMIPLPREYRESQPLAGIYSSVFVVPWADTLLVGYAGSDDLHLATQGGTLVDTVSLPIRARRGVPDDIVKRLPKLQWPEMIASASALFGLGRFADGRVAAVHLDQVVNGSSFTADGFVSVLSADRRRACVDGALPLSKDTSPRVLFRGDTLFVLQQRLTEDERAETSITGFLLNTDRCRWLPVDR
ncbi:hypothetical protein [Longimicrobium sp.]|uniref:hypothetical protein n=1 Tax=Longimicrobium sp. TaxID=2029185 RepID=UPI003B3ABED1